jgi:WXG100 family type VII secretion target
MAEEIRCNYDEMKQVQQRFATEAQQINEMLRKVRQSMNQLKPGWIGRGSNAFFSEMEGKVLPGVDRLGRALQEAADVSGKIAAEVRKAEEEAGAPFRVR